MTLRRSRTCPSAVASLVAASLLLAAPMAFAQSVNPAVCARFEAQLASLDTADGSPQVERYREAINRQQLELERTAAYARRIGCDQGGGFFLFGPQRPAQCEPLNEQIGRMRTNIERMRAELGRVTGTDGSRDIQRRQILSAMRDAGCIQFDPRDPRFAALAPRDDRPRNFLDQLFGGWRDEEPDIDPNAMPSSGFTTVCVRTCDGSFFPVAFSANPQNFRAHEQVCRAMCPAQEVHLYSFRAGAESIERAVSINGRPYMSLPTALRFRQEYNPACACKRPDQTWSEANGGQVDRTVMPGDIVVTPETAELLSRPGGTANLRAPASQTARQRRDQPAPQGRAAAAPEPASPAPAIPAAPPPGPDGQRQVRVIGPDHYRVAR